MNDERVATPAHAKLGASNCERWSVCGGSTYLIPYAPAELPNIYAAEGTVAHALAADAVNLAMAGLSPEFPISVKQEGFDIPVTQEMRDAINVYVDQIMEISEQYDLSYKNVYVEQKISIPDIDGDDTTLFGTADCGIVVPFNCIYVLDFKYGAGVPVSAIDNKQLKYYLLGFYLSLPESVRAEIPELIGMIVQPRIPTGEVMTQESYTPEQIEEFHQWLVASAAEVTMNASLVPGDHCRWCRAQPICPAVKNYAQQQLEIDFIDAVEVIEQKQLPVPTEITPEHLGVLLNNVEIMHKYLDSLMNYGYSCLQNGIKIPGWKLVDKRSNRKWKDELEVVKHFKEKGCSDVAIYKTPALKSPNEMEKLLGKARVPAELWEKPDNGQTMARDNDTRPGVEPRAITDFEGIEL